MNLDINIEQWIEVSWYIFDTYEQMRDEKLKCFVHKIDIPRHMLDRWQWLINWRTAKYQYLNPRKKIIHYYSYYDKKTGLDTAVGSLLQKYTSAKGQVTKVKNAIEKYKGILSETLFQDFENDTIYKQLTCKLKEKEQILESLEIELQNTIKTTEPYTQPLRN